MIPQWKTVEKKSLSPRIQQGMADVDISVRFKRSDGRKRRENLTRVVHFEKHIRDPSGTEEFSSKIFFVQSPRVVYILEKYVTNT